MSKVILASPLLCPLPSGGSYGTRAAQSIIDAIAVKHVDDLRTLLEAQFSTTVPEDGRMLLGAIVDAYMGFRG